MDIVGLLETIGPIRFVLRRILECKLEVTILGIPQPRFYSYQGGPSRPPLPLLGSFLEGQGNSPVRGIQDDRDSC